MKVIVSRVPRSLTCALLLGLALTPLSPDTGSVSATPQIPNRVETAHAVIDAAASKVHTAGFFR
ncbi:hypothetical protein [Terrihabitans rhizophilus]|jgi:hypothetical protein|uniref:Uncharacterized protein n=1 Tax=Terrihabitans rhizophilus TaxID=3092662 RepID=A0ABU4RMK1_9HYPH|nr:hypothetical protein [Terrihabitans sp. PJ23]MDX6806047.1 hypothetical protein [Terrihabitans sp. PJ23]